MAGDVVMQNFDWGAVKLDAALSQLMPASDYFGDESLSPKAGWPAELSYSYGSFNGGAREYTLKPKGEKLWFIARGLNGVTLDIDREVDPDVMAHAAQSILENELDNWNGFDERDVEVLDGYDFALEYRRRGDDVRAHGYERYPDNYEQAHRHLASFFDRLVEVYG